MDDLNHLNTPYDRIEYLQNLLIDHATGGNGSNEHYQLLRQEALEHSIIGKMLPRWVKVNRNLAQFWQFIKNEYGTYAERRKFIWQAFGPVLELLEANSPRPAENSISEALEKFDSESVHLAWTKALERKSSDPEGAITLARTILESVCKHILDELQITYTANIELSELYKLTASELNLSPEQHSEQVFKQILGGCSGIVNGLGSLRNKLGDAHGKGKKQIKPAPRHAELAVNLSGSMAVFLISTFAAKHSA